MVKRLDTMRDRCVKALQRRKQEAQAACDCPVCTTARGAAAMGGNPIEAVLKMVLEASADEPPPPRGQKAH